MSEAMYWLNVNLIMVALMWIPYVLDRILKQGLGAMGYREDLPAVSPWALRAKKAHSNTIENLVVFAPAVIGFMMLDGANFEVIKCSVEIFFFSRIVYYFSYTLKIPYIRTLAFFAGWGSTIYILVSIFQSV